MTEFEDISIIGFDNERTYNPNPPYQVYDIYLALSHRPPSVWGKIFEQERRFPRHTLWRRARVSGSHIILQAPLDELEKTHLPDLHVDMKNVNDKFRKYLEEEAIAQEKKLAEEEAERQKLLDIKDRLTFDKD
ncbi:MAG: hypothetical protein OXI34_10045 [Chloroflexota bacterium]|nr:hypothetical protein [Chloroflexota bacterium]MDE2947531.1 hypothetical protein [Chloroflexota bacterium]